MTITQSNLKEFDYSDKFFPVKLLILKGEELANWPEFLELHWHPELQMTVCTQGEIEMMLEGRHIILHEKEALFINRNILHQLVYASQDARAFAIDFSESILTFHANSRMDIDCVKPYTNSYQIAGFALTEHTTWQQEAIHHAMVIYYLYTEHNAHFTEYEIAIHLSQLWLLLCRHTKKAQQISTQAHFDKDHLEAAQLMLSYIYKHYTEKILLEDIAESGHVSTTECGRIFHAFTQQSPHQYLTSYRLQRACHYLTRFPHRTVTDIAQDVGFNQTSSFIRQFTRRYGMTPQRYRMQARNQ